MAHTVSTEFERVSSYERIRLQHRSTFPDPLLLLLNILNGRVVSNESVARTGMKLTIPREQLQEGLVAVAASVPAKTTLPILSNILLEATKEGIRLSGTDLDIAVSTTVPASIDEDGAITL